MYVIVLQLAEKLSELCHPCLRYYCALCTDLHFRPGAHVQCILVPVSSARTAAWAGQTQKIHLSLSIWHKLSNLLLQLTTITINIEWTSTWKVVEFSFKVSIIVPQYSQKWRVHLLWLNSDSANTHTHNISCDQEVRTGFDNLLNAKMFIEVPPAMTLTFAEVYYFFQYSVCSLSAACDNFSYSGVC